MNCGKCQTCKYTYECKEDSWPSVPAITNLFLGLTNDCNCACRYCFVHHNLTSMTYEMAKKGLDWLSVQSTAPMKLTFFGGEPTLKWDDVIVPLVNYGKAKYGNQLSFNITTNGLNLTEDMLIFMKNNSMDIHFSFDGVKGCQDFNRPARDRSSSFDTIEPKISMILKYFPFTTMRMTVHNETVGFFYENHAFAVEHGFTNTFAALNTFASWTDDEFGVLEGQMYKVADLYISLKKSGKSITFNPLVRDMERIDYLSQIPTPTRRKILSSGLPGYGKCGIGANKSMVMSPEGNFYTCQEIYTNETVRDYFAIGNITDGIDDSRRLEIANSFLPWQVKCANFNRQCSNCEISNVCNGECLIRNYEQYQDLNLIPDSACRHSLLTYKVGKYIKRQLEGA